MSHMEESALTPTPSRWVWTALFVLCAIAVAAVVRRLVALFIPAAAAGPPQMAALDAAFASRTILTTAHIVPALLFVLLLPAWFSRSVRDHTGVHRRITHALHLLGAVTGITALPLCLHPIGGINEAAAALLYDCFFLFSLTRAWIMFRRNDLALHRTWMIRAVAILLGIATTRPVMGLFFATQSITHLQPQQFFGTAFWIGFTITYIAGEAYIRSHESSATYPERSLSPR